MLQRGRKSSAALAAESAVVRALPTGIRAVPPPEAPEPPSHLGRPERRLWRDVVRQYEVTSAAAAAVLRTGLEAHQRAREAREAIKRDGMTVTGRDGQAKPHPLLATERDARQAFLAAIRMLGLDL